MEELIPRQGKQVAASIRVRMWSVVNDVVLQNVSINKGATLRLLMELVSPSLTAEGGPVWEVIFGDDLADLSMLLPDLEILAVDDVHASSLDVRDQRARALGIVVQRESLAPHWFLSVIPSRKLYQLRISGSDTVKKALDSPKILSVEGFGILGMIQAMVRKFVAEISQHPLEKTADDPI